MTPTAREALYTRINFENQTAFNTSNSVLSAPSINTDAAYETKNTKVLLTGIPDAGFNGTVPFWYNRIPITEFSGLDVVSLVWEGEQRIWDFIPKLNETFELNLLEDDIVDSGLPNPDETMSQFSIVMNTDSYGFIGSFMVRITKPPVNIEDEVSDPELDGLNQGDFSAQQ